MSISIPTLKDPPAACLRRFQMSRDAEAFREIVSCYGGLVEGTARRLLEDAESARDVAQQVFIDLAKAAPGLRAESQLGGWLHRHTVFVASHHRQAESRRRRREQVAAERMQDVGEVGAEAGRLTELHQALTKLPEADRALLVLRYWENKPLREVGAALKIGEDAAQKRVTRALEKLRQRLASGTAPALGVLGGMLASGSSSKACDGPWVAEVTRSAMEAGAVVEVSGWGGIPVAFWKAGLVGAVVGALVCGAVLGPKLRQQEPALTDFKDRQKVVRLAEALPVSETLSNPMPDDALEKRIADLEGKLAAKSVREQWVDSNLKRARERADRDRLTFSADDLTELESGYQLAKQQSDPAAHAAALVSLIEKFRASNRAGCAVLRLARLSTGPERERWLQEAITHHSDAFYLDGTSVGAMTRLYLAAEYAQSGRHAEAAELRQEIAAQFPEATDHDGLPVMESLTGTMRPD